MAAAAAAAAATGSASTLRAQVCAHLSLQRTRQPVRSAAGRVHACTDGRLPGGLRRVCARSHGRIRVGAVQRRALAQ
jgi:hypothetical protein